jgi:hypothetical protein
VDEANSSLPIPIEALGEGGKGGSIPAEPKEEGVE